MHETFSFVSISKSISKWQCNQSAKFDLTATGPNRIYICTHLLTLRSLKNSHALRCKFLMYIIYNAMVYPICLGSSVTIKGLFFLSFLLLPYHYSPPPRSLKWESTKRQKCLALYFSTIIYGVETTWTNHGASPGWWAWTEWKMPKFRQATYYFRRIQGQGLSGVPQATTRSVWSMAPTSTSSVTNKLLICCWGRSPEGKTQAIRVPPFLWRPARPTKMSHLKHFNKANESWSRNWNGIQDDLGTSKQNGSESD